MKLFPQHKLKHLLQQKQEDDRAQALLRNLELKPSDPIIYSVIQMSKIISYQLLEAQA